MNAWLTLSPATANILGVRVDGVGNRGFALHNGLGYYDQKLIQIFLSTGLNQAIFTMEGVSDFVTEITLHPRMLLNFLKPLHPGEVSLSIVRRFYGVPSFQVVADESQNVELRDPQPWPYGAILKSSDTWFREKNCLTINLTLRSEIPRLLESLVRMNKGETPALVFATFKLSKNDLGLSYSYASEYVDEDLAIRFLNLDARLASRKSENPIRAKKMSYYSVLTRYQGRGGQ